MAYMKIVFTASSTNFNPLKCSTSSKSTELCSHCVFMFSMLFSGHITMNSLMIINCSILVMLVKHIVQKAILILETQCTIHISLCGFGWTSDFEVPNSQGNTFHCHISENLMVSTLCSGVVFQSGQINVSTLHWRWTYKRNKLAENPKRAWSLKMRWGLGAEIFKTYSMNT